MLTLIKIDGILMMRKELIMTEKEIQLIQLMIETGMNKYTVAGVLQAVETEEQVQQTIDYIEEWKDIITDHQLRQEIIFEIAPPKD